MATTKSLTTSGKVEGKGRFLFNRSLQIKFLKKNINVKERTNEMRSTIQERIYSRGNEKNTSF